MQECNVARAAATMRATPIYAGTNEIMKELIGKDITRN